MKRYIGLTVATFVVGVAIVTGLKRTRLGMTQHVGDHFAWRGTMTPGAPVWIRNTYGSVNVEIGTGDSIEILAEKRWRRGDPQSVQIRVLSEGNGFTACAVWPARQATCEPGGRYEHVGARRNDVRVTFTVRVPPSARVDVSTYNGEISIHGPFGATTARTQNGDIEVGDVRGPVQARSTNGDIDVETREGPVTAVTVSGDVSAVLHALGAPGDIVLQSVNGDVDINLPEVLNADVTATTVNGRVETDYPVTMTGRINPKSLHVTIGRGGRKIGLETVNGSITIGKTGGN